jgi:hypothetical protein
MAKRSVEGYSPIVASLQEANWSLDPALVAKLVRIAGPLPHRRFERLLWSEKAGWMEVKLSARDYLVFELEAAARRYFRERQEQGKPTAAQLSSAFEAIERAAYILLGQLGVRRDPTLDRMPSAIRFGGLQAEAATDNPAEGQKRLKAAVDGVDALHRWARAAKNRQQNIYSRKKRIRNEGDKALNEYLHEVIVNCWEHLYEREVTTVGTRLTNFAIAAASAVGVRLGDTNAVSKRLQRVFNRARPRKTRTKCDRQTETE